MGKCFDVRLLSTSRKLKRYQFLNMDSETCGKINLKLCLFYILLVYDALSEYCVHFMYVLFACFNI